MNKYIFNSDKSAIIDINPGAFEDNTIVFPSEIDGYKITSVAISAPSLVNLNSMFKRFDVVIEEGITEIGKKMFSESNIRSITIPSSVDRIPYGCFRESKLQEVIFQGNSSLKTICKFAFAYCPNLKAISFPPSLGEIKERAFRDSGLTEIIFTNTNNNLHLGELVFAECNDLTKAILPESKVTLDKFTFFGCRKLETVNILKSDIETIPNGMFLCCTALKDILLPKTVHVIEERAFCECKSLTTVGLCHTGVRRIEKEAFKAASSYSDYKFPSTIKSIGSQAFMECNLSKISLSFFSGLNEINSEAFAKNPISEEIDLRPLICCDKIGDGIFSSTNVETVTVLPFYGTNVSAKNMFEFCKNLKTVNMVKEAVLYEGMFNCCSSLESVTLSDAIKNIPQHCFRRTNIKNIKFPKSLQSIDYCAFCYSTLEELDLSDTDVTKIASGAFGRVKLKSIKLPPYCCQIRKDAFAEEQLEMIKENSVFLNII